VACSPVILVVDDDDRVRSLIARILTESGYVVLDAPDGQEAADLLTAIEPALLMTDSRMPRMTGEALIAAARARNPDLRIVRVTGAGDPFEGVPTLRKPFSDDELLEVVRQSLEHSPP